MQRSLALQEQRGKQGSEEDPMLAAALAVSLEDARKQAADAADAEAAALRQAVKASTEASAEPYDPLLEAALEVSREKSTPAAPFDPLLEAALQESREMAGGAIIIDDGLGGFVGSSGAARGRAESNAVRALEEGFSRTEGMPAVETAAAARSRALSSGAGVFSGGASAAAAVEPSAGNNSSGGGSGGIVQYRSDSMKRVYEAQHRFVLAQLTAPGVEAFLADDDESDDDADGADGSMSRTVSKFV